MSACHPEVYLWTGRDKRQGIKKPRCWSLTVFEYEPQTQYGNSLPCFPFQAGSVLESLLSLTPRSSSSSNYQTFGHT